MSCAVDFPVACRPREGGGLKHSLSMSVVCYLFDRFTLTCSLVESLRYHLRHGCQRREWGIRTTLLVFSTQIAGSHRLFVFQDLKALTAFDVLIFTCALARPNSRPHSHCRLPNALASMSTLGPVSFSLASWPHVRSVFVFTCSSLPNPEHALLPETIEELSFSSLGIVKRQSLKAANASPKRFQTVKPSRALHFRVESLVFETPNSRTPGCCLFHSVKL